MYGTDKELRRAMKKHLRAGITPGQFGMDGLRLEEQRYRTMVRANGGLTGREAALVFACFRARVLPILEWFRDALRRRAAILRMGM